MLLKAHRPLPVGKVTPTNPLTAGAWPIPAAGPLRHAPPPTATFRYVGVPTSSRLIYVMALLISAALHAGLILGFSEHKVPRKAVVVKDEVIEIMVMPELKEEEEKKVEELNNEEQVAPTIPVPMLQDVPLSLTEAAFTQLIDPTVPTKIEGAGSVMSIPLNIQRGKPDMSGMKDLFNVADLDRKPEPVMQLPPTYPFEQKQSTSEAQVRVGFIVTAKGDVVMPYIISSSHAGFERATLEAVVKWKFKAGQRDGHKVNTRVEQLINFQVIEGQ